MLKQTCIDQYYKSVSKHSSNAANIKKRSTITSPGTKRKNIKISRNASSSFTIVNSNISQVLEICLDDENSSENDLEIISHVQPCGNDHLEQISQNVQRKRNSLNTNELDLKIPKRKQRNYSNVKRRSLVNQTALSNSPVKVQATQSCDNHLRETPSCSPDKNDFSLRKSSNSFSSPCKSNYMYKAQSPKTTLNSSPVKVQGTHSWNNNNYFEGTLSNGQSSPNLLLRNNSPSTPRKSNYTYKVQSQQSPRTFVQRKLFGDNIDTSIVEQSIEHLNLAKQGAIPLLDLNLEEIYSKTTFNYQYSNINSKTQVKYELNDIIICDDLNPKTLFTTIFNVFSNPVNCGYFHESELDFIYSILTLPIDAQKLLACMIKRKKGWFRKSNINYPKISENLKDIFEILASRSICSFDIKSENLLVILNLLQVDEIRQLCQKMKIDRKGSKEDNINKLLKLAKAKPLFPGMKDPTSTLYDSVFNILEYCVCISNETWDIINKIVTLLLPNEDPKNSFAETFDMLCNTYLGKIIYPSISGYIFPVFPNWRHLESYIKAKSVWSKTLKSIEKKKWDEVQKNGDSAMNVLPKLLETDLMTFANSALPTHVRRYRPAYVWLKILDASVDAFKKVSEKKRAVEILNFLLKQDCYLHAYKGKWYAELALIEMHHHKNIETSASIVLQALNEEKLTEVDKVNLMERAKKICKKKGGVNSNTKAAISKALDENIHHMPKDKTAFITIDGTLMPRHKTGNKTVWCIQNTAENQSYGSVETVAFHYYRNQGFPKGLHCEGTLPIALFFTLFWEELYDVHIPGAFVTPYSEAPGDLFTEQFYENRKEKIDSKFERMSVLNSEKFSSLMGERFQRYRQYRSVMSLYLQDDLEMKEIVHCLGSNGVIGICKRLTENFKLWKAGFPDLIVWNYETKKHKIVEVKGPRDVLSTKQKLWLEYLHELGLNVELCLVEDKFNKKRKSEAMNESDV